LFVLLFETALKNEGAEIFEACTGGHWFLDRHENHGSFRDDHHTIWV
jgi:hypothetical protein